MASNTSQASLAVQSSVGNDICDYVTELQLHMALQARHLLPGMQQLAADHRLQFLHQAQVESEKSASRQWL